MNNTVRLQGFLSIAALLCLVVGWFDFLPQDISDLLYGRVFYILIGASFILQAKMLPNKKFVYPMYIASALSVIGAFLPFDSEFVMIKTVGLFVGVIISMFNRPSVSRD